MEYLMRRLCDVAPYLVILCIRAFRSMIHSTTRLYVQLIFLNHLLDQLPYHSRSFFFFFNFNRLQFSIRIFTFITMCIGQFPSIGSLSLKQFSDLVAWKKKRGEVKTQLSKKALSKIVSQKICHRELVF